jgi:hypothetical protein
MHQPDGRTIQRQAHASFGQMEPKLLINRQENSPIADVLKE